MIAQYLRFHGHGSLRYVYANGKPQRGRYCILKTIQNPRRNRPRMAVVVSKKVCKGAVGRNRIRRRIYEVLRAEMPGIEKRTDLVIVVTSAEVRTVPYDELVRSVRDLLARSRVYRQAPLPR